MITKANWIFKNQKPKWGLTHGLIKHFSEQNKNKHIDFTTGLILCP